MGRTVEGDRDRWARLRFMIIGPLLAAPPEPGALQQTLVQLAARHWRHPVTGEAVRFGRSTIERWYYAAKNARTDPVAALRRGVRKDAGRQRSLSTAIGALLYAQYHAHPSWTVQLHYDNLAVRLREDPALGAAPSYASVRRYFAAQGLFRQARRSVRDSAARAEARERLARVEVRSYESAHTNALWHADFHHGTHPVLSRTGVWQKPVLLGVIDDHSRLACHLQWYLAETAETFVHGLSQALQKRALPRALMTDNGAPMLAAEVTAGLHTLGIVHETTLPYSPYQNAKQETFWASVESRLMAMLEGCAELTLERLNEATQAWVEMEYNRRSHSELGCSPLARYGDGTDVGRECPGSERLRQAFRTEAVRTQRRSDGTFSLESTRFEVPSRYRHLARLTVRYARWDLRTVELIDPLSGTPICALYPLDKTAHASAARRLHAVRTPTVPILPDPPAHSPMAPLLRALMVEYAATGLPPAYVPLSNDAPLAEDPLR
ncbi:MAG: transposase [Pseudomonadales bacterium]|jgi:putative transposase|nr:transposase [Pseudomonadales bacterium]MCP5336381.1 transposase [Pseudomonadales bacterium]MCP5337044.1 transposase [Pseudomonadales bacterium]